MKVLFRVLLLLALTVVAIFAILLVLKPGASIFHLKQSIQNEGVRLHTGHAFRSPVNLNTLLFPLQNVLLYENGSPLDRTYTREVIEVGEGKYALIEQDGRSYLNFSASDNSNPLTNERQYTLYYKPIFLSRGLGLSLLGLLTLGLAWFLIFALRSGDGKRKLITSPPSIWQTWDDFIFLEIPRTIMPIQNKQTLTNSRRTIWIYLSTITCIAAYFYVFMEWIFFVTKPSFMDLMGWLEKIEHLILPSFGLAILSLTLVILFAGLDYFFSQLHITTFFVFLATLVPSIILAAISLLLVDNFTYTILNFGVVTTSGIWRFLYGLGALFVFIYINNRILHGLRLRGLPEPPVKLPRLMLASAITLFVLSTGFILSWFGFRYADSAHEASSAGFDHPFTSRPNILLIGSDGLNAANMSLYGYERDTTPVLSELAKSSLLAENAFTNSTNSAGSITSMLTGKPPAQTRVLYPPNILQGIDAYQHLPGILRKEGYYNVEIGVSHYVDAHQVNLLDGFDVINDRSINEEELFTFMREIGFGTHAYFVSGLKKRISDRISHISFLKKMENPFAIVTQPIVFINDRERRDQLLELIQQTDRPFFVHAHLMGTHGDRFFPEQRTFSSGKNQDESWMIDFYDDSILDFDKYIGELLETLEETGKFNNTILIIYSDHSMQHDGKKRVPLLIHFPNDEFAIRIKTNVQNLDINPTILEYLGIDQPAWMPGQSLLIGDPPQDRLIFTPGTGYATRVGPGRLEIDTNYVKPPFYHFSYFHVIHCQEWYLINLVDSKWDSGAIQGHTMPCRGDRPMTIDRVKHKLAEHLTNNGFEISSLP